MNLKKGADCFHLAATRAPEAFGRSCAVYSAWLRLILRLVIWLIGSLPADAGSGSRAHGA